MSRNIEPAVLLHIANALADLQLARDATKYGFVDDHIANAIEELVKAINCSLNNGM
jgi:DNA-binding MltR family transcriptional regulator